MSKSSDGYIDVQSHFLPSVYVEAIDAAGMKNIDGWAIPKWDVPAALATMERLGARAQLLSLSSPGVSFLKGRRAQELARSVNEFAASTVRDYSPRFGAFATLPLPDVDAALEELTYALDTLKLDGVALLSNYDGIYLGDPEFVPLFDELNRRKAVVFTHPGPPPGFDSISVGATAPILEFPFETTRIALNLLKSGTIERCRDMQIILPHGGGTIPFLRHRMGFVLGSERTALLSSFFYDLTAASMPEQLAALAAFVPASKLLMGVDFPFMPDVLVNLFLGNLQQANFSPEEWQALRCDNALQLFPMLAERLASQPAT